MSKMFYRAAMFTQDIGAWDVSNVRDMSYMFAYDSCFNQTLDSWDISGYTNVDHMFYLSDTWYLNEGDCN